MPAKVRAFPIAARTTQQRPGYGLLVGHAVLALIAIALASLTVAVAEQRLSGGASLSAIEAAYLTAGIATATAPR